MKFVNEVPMDKQRKYDWDNITTALRSRPGQWAIIEADGVKDTDRAAQATSRNIRNGRIKGIKPGEFDAKTRGKTIYARYVGDA